MPDTTGSIRHRSAPSRSHSDPAVLFAAAAGIGERLKTRGLWLGALPAPLDVGICCSSRRISARCFRSPHGESACFVESRYVLNLRTMYAPTEDKTSQPFAENYLALHSEGSWHASAMQPDYVVLQCVSSGRRDNGGQTIVTPMRLVAQPLPLREAITERADVPTSPRPTCASSAANPARSTSAFAISTAHSYPGSAYCPRPTLTNAAALNASLAAMYEAPAYGVELGPGMVCVVDNRRFFHGRTAILNGIGKRHLKGYV